jgi:hypothetical protein
MRIEVPPDLPPEEERAVRAAIEASVSVESTRPNPWMMAGRATVLGLGALQIRYAATRPWDARFHPFSPVAPEPVLGRGDAK